MSSLRASELSAQDFVAVTTGYHRVVIAMSQFTDQHQNEPDHRCTAERPKQRGE